VALNIGVANGSGTFSGVIQNSTGNLALQKLGTGVQVLTGNNTYTGPTTVSAGTLQIGNGGAAGSINSTSAITNNATLAYNTSSGFLTAPSISGSGNLVVTGAGTLQLNGGSSYTGATLIKGGVLQLGTPGSLAGANAGTPLVWFDPSNSGNYSLTGSNVTSLTNLGSSGGNAVPVNNRNGPTLTMNNPAFNGLTTLHGNGAQELGRYDLSGLNNSSYTIFSVAAMGGGFVPNTTNYYYLGSEAAGLQDQCLHFGYRAVSSTTATFTLAQYSDDLNYTTAPGYNGTEVANVWAGSLNTAMGHAVYLNGTQVASNNSITPLLGLTGPSGNNYGIIGAGYGGNSMFLGDVGEVLIYATTLSAAQMAGVTQYLEAKWQGGILPASSPVTLSGGGTLDLNGNNQTLGSLSSNDPTTAVLVESGLLTVGSLNTNTTFAGSISGGGVTKIGTGLFALAGSNGYTGTTLVLNGTLLLGNSNALSGSTFDTSGIGALSFQGGIGGFAFGGLQGSGSLLLTNLTGADVALSVGSNNSNTTLFGSLSDTRGGGSLTKVGSGTLTLSGTNTYGGGTFVNSGTLIVTNPGAIADGTSLTVGDASLFPAPVVPAPVAGSAVSAVPEPGSLLLLAAGGVLLVMVRRHRHNKK
jgi:autotransporter-associated beta strand protein